VDALAIAGRLAAAELKVPVIMLFTSFAANDKFSLCRHWPVYPDTNPARARAKALAAELSDKYGTPAYDVHGIFEGKGDLNIVTQPASFHPAAETFDDSFVFAGPQIMKRVDSGAWEAPEGDAPLVYTSLGTLFNAWPEFYHILYGVVKDMDLRLVSSVGSTLKKEEIGEIPANVKIFPFLPQLEVLENADFFITHAGIGSVMEAACYGVPMLAIPQMDEQAFTASCMVKAGLGIVIPKEGLTPEKLKTGIQELIGNPVYKKNAEKMSAELQTLGGAYAADRIMEFMAGRA
jgi:MGT family glycosyltransferase